MPMASARNGERKPHQFVLVESTDHLAAYLFAYHKHAQGHEVNVGKIPDFFLQSHTSAHFLQALALADDKRILAHPSGCSCRLACCHKDSSSSIDAWRGERPAFSSCRSIH